MSLNRSEKEAVISDVTGLAAKAQTLVMAEYRGITVADMTKLRNTARSNGVSLSVLKNTLARRAVAGSAFEVVSDQMTGPLIYGFSEDAVAAAKVVAEFAKTNDKLVIRAGADPVTVDLAAYATERASVSVTAHAARAGLAEDDP